MMITTMFTVMMMCYTGWSTSQCCQNWSDEQVIYKDVINAKVQENRKIKSNKIVKWKKWQKAKVAKYPIKNQIVAAFTTSTLHDCSAPPSLRSLWMRLKDKYEILIINTKTLSSSTLSFHIIILLTTSKVEVMIQVLKLSSPRPSSPSSSSSPS